MRCSSTSSTNRAGSQTSWNTPVAPFCTASRPPYRKPVRCANVDAMWITLSDVMPSRSGSGLFAATRVLWVCITPFGSPVVPEVKISRVTSFGSGRSSASSAGSRRSSHGVAMNSGPGRGAPARGAVHDQHVRERRPGHPQLVHRARVVEAAELRRHDDDLRAGEADHEADLPLPVDGDQRVADRPDP